MTVREMQAAFDMQIQLISKTLEIQDKPDSYTILYFLNSAQDKFLRDNYLSKGRMADNIQYIQQRSDVLRNLIVRDTQTESGTPIASTEVDGGIELDLPADFLYYMQSFSYATNSLAGIESPIWTPNRLVEHSEVDSVVGALFNKPILRKPCVLFEENDKAILYKDIDTEIYNISYIYLRKPLLLTLAQTPESGYTDECELDPYLHDDIVELAVKMFVEDYKYKLGVPAAPQPQQ
jgi:hypothetical protein